MTFKFAWLVELLQALDLARTSKALPEARNVNPDHKIVVQWFKKYERYIDRHGSSAVSFLSCLFPERVPQRSYHLQERRLGAIFGRALGLGSTRARKLNQWREHGRLDFAACVEEVMRECEPDRPSPSRQVTLEDIDAALLQLAANAPSSAPKIRQAANDKSTYDILAPILRRLASHEAKWLVRMILKSYGLVQIPGYLALYSFHFLLPKILAVQNDLEAAIEVLGHDEIRRLPFNPEKEQEKTLAASVATHFSPKLGVMVKRQPYDKARSIKHCCSMAGKRLVSVERKYDGEYCQIHVTRKGSDFQIQIFSKSGKDSTDDRIRLHGSIGESLRLNRKGGKIKERCILEGELLVWSRSKKVIEPFHKIRRHVLHGGRWLGIENNSPAAADEQLMIMFYDVLLVDQWVVAREPHKTRRRLLKGLVKRLPGEADVCERFPIDFASGRAAAQLRTLFAKAIRQNWEGFVLKAETDPYFSLTNAPRGIKLKKDYITGLGESVDLCIVGARRDPMVARELGVAENEWTTFYMGCIENRDSLQRFGDRPCFKVIDVFVPGKADVKELNRRGQFVQIPFDTDCPDISVDVMFKGSPNPSVLFKTPFVVEIMGAGFDRNSNCGFYTVRFPRIAKLHLDRTPEETMSFADLQEQAIENMRIGRDAEATQDAEWIDKLVKADGKTQPFADSQTTTPGTSPRSAATLSLSSVSTRKPRPLFVRVDSDDMTPQEIQARISESQTTASPTESPLVRVTGNKRSCREMSSAPTPALTAKRAKVNEMESSPLATMEACLAARQKTVSGTERGQSSGQPIRTAEIPANRHGNARTSTSPASRPDKSSSQNDARPVGLPVLNGKTPSSTPDSVGTNHVQSRNRRNSSRRPLEEIANVPSAAPGRPHGADEGAATSISKSATEPAAADQVPCKKMLERACEPNAPTLLTPPSTEENAAEHHQAGNTSSKGKARGQEPAAVSNPAASHHSAPSIKATDLKAFVNTTTIRAAGPLLLGNSLLNSEHNCLHIGLNRALRALDGSFTHSCRHFLKHVMPDTTTTARKPASNLVLVDNRKPHAAALDIRDVGRQAVATWTTQQQRQQLRDTKDETFRVDVVDWRYLAALTDTADTSAGDASESAAWEKFLCCTIDFGPGITDGDGKGAVAARVGWAGRRAEWELRDAYVR